MPWKLSVFGTLQIQSKLWNLASKPNVWDLKFSSLLIDDSRFVLPWTLCTHGRKARALLQKPGVAHSAFISLLPSPPPHTFQPLRQPAQRGPGSSAKEETVWDTSGRRKKAEPTWRAAFSINWIQRLWGPCQSLLPVASEAHFEDFHQLILIMCPTLYQSVFPICMHPMPNDQRYYIRGHDQDPPWKVSEWILFWFSSPTSGPCLPFAVQLLLQRRMGGNRYPLFCLWSTSSLCSALMPSPGDSHISSCSCGQRSGLTSPGLFACTHPFLPNWNFFTFLSLSKDLELCDFLLSLSVKTYCLQKHFYD